jgi:DNA-binding transcriptional ArsR family regulator
MDGKEVKTSIDKLIDYLNEHGETDSDSLVSALKIDESTLSMWANVLEEAHVVKVEYKFAKMYMSLTIPSKGKKKPVQNEIASLETIERIKELLIENRLDGVNPQE